MPTKNPRRVAAGRRGVRRRWGKYPRIIRLDGLDDRARAMVVAAVEAARADAPADAPVVPCSAPRTDPIAVADDDAVTALLATVREDDAVTALLATVRELDHEFADPWGDDR